MNDAQGFEVAGEALANTRQPGLKRTPRCSISRALKTLPDDYVVVGVANNSLTSAQKTAAAFGHSAERSTPQ